MAIGQRIKFFRNKIGMTQKQLGEELGFHGKTSDVRMAQYESETRIPKIDLIMEMAQIFNVNTYAINVPNIDTYDGLMHTLFAFEDMYGLKITKIDGKTCLQFDPDITPRHLTLGSDIELWQSQAAKLEQGELTKEEYDAWRYNFPKSAYTTEKLSGLSKIKKMTP